MNSISITTQEENDYNPNQYNNDTRFEGRTKELFTYFTSYARILNGQGWTKEYLMKELDAELDDYSEINEDYTSRGENFIATTSYCNATAEDKIEYMADHKQLELPLGDLK